MPQILPVNKPIGNQDVGHGQEEGHIRPGPHRQPLVAVWTNASPPRVYGHNLHTPLSSLKELLGPGNPAKLVSARVRQVPTEGKQVPAVAEVGVEDTVEPYGVLTCSVGGIGAVSAVAEQRRP